MPDGIMKIYAYVPLALVHIDPKNYTNLTKEDIDPIDPCSS